MEVEKALAKASRIARKLSQDESNPRLVWKKKIERDVKEKKFRLKDLSLKAEKEKQKNQLQEIEKIRKRRTEMVLQRDQREAILRRARLVQVEEEEEVHNNNELQQAHLIHTLERSLSLEDEEKDHRYVWEVFDHLSIKELKELHGDLAIQVKAGSNTEFWEALITLCDQKLKGSGTDALVVEDDLDQLFQGSSVRMISEQERKIHSQMKTGEAKNVDFWEAVLRRLPCYEARAKLRELSARLPAGWYHKSQSDDLEKRSDVARVGPVDLVDLGVDQSGYVRPQFVATVHTGYEWNKYNQTHYDHDNPPPKHVQGYKFIIAYPKIGAEISPTYRVVEVNKETSVLWFSAGRPYQDIAFAVVNDEWECSPKKGFRSTFDGSVVHLCFQLKKHRYRR